MFATRLELSNGASHKFWEVHRQGATLRARWGRIGTEGQTLDKAYSTAVAERHQREARAHFGSRRHARVVADLFRERTSASVSA
jgi:predicted DNA-binding WGR domain protein